MFFQKEVLVLVLSWLSMGFLSSSSGKLKVCELENGPVEIVDIYPSKMLDLSIVFRMFTRPGR
jgi:hypothetical protein